MKNSFLLIIYTYTIVLGYTTFHSCLAVVEDLEEQIPVTQEEKIATKFGGQGLRKNEDKYPRFYGEAFDGQELHTGDFNNKDDSTKEGIVKMDKNNQQLGVPFDEEKLLEWLISQNIYFELSDIVEVSREMLDKLMDENEVLAVYFYDRNDEESLNMLEHLEKIDSEADSTEVTIVRMRDPIYGRKWGVTNFPSIVYFRNRFPSIYRGGFKNELEVSKWLRKKRYRRTELNFFMYALIAITLAFVMYTVFLVYGFQQTPKVA